MTDYEYMAQIGLTKGWRGPGVNSGLSQRVAMLVRTAWLPLLLTLTALALRVYDLTTLSWVPDNHEQLAATERLLRLELPLSRIYPPGVAILMAPFVAIFPHDIATLQAVIVAAGVAMVPLGYVAALKITQDPRAATLFAGFLAVDPNFVYKSRDPHYDLLVALLLGVALVLLPTLLRANLLACVGYGILLATIVNIRQTNLALLPPLAMYWVALQLSTKRWREFTCKTFWWRPLVAGVTLSLLFIAGALLGGWWGQTAGASVTFEHYPEHLRFYTEVLFGRWPFLPVYITFATYGIWRLSVINAPLAVAILAVLIVWPLAHAPFSWTTGRYMLPAQLCVAFLATYGASQAWSLAGTLSSPWRGATRRAVAPAFVFVMAASMVVPSIIIVHDWPTIKSRSDEGSLGQMRPIVASLDKGALLISGFALGLRSANPDVEQADLLDYHIRLGAGERGQTALVNFVAEQMASGRPIYYLYTRWEDGHDYEGDGRSGFANFWQAVSTRFELVPITKSPPTDDLQVRPWALYKVEPKR